MRNVFRCYELFLQMMRLADMAKFEFRMQSILNITNQMETQSKMEYAAAQSELRRAEDYMVQLKNERVSYIEEGARLREHSLNVVDMRENTRAIEHTDDKIEAQKSVIEGAQKKVDEAREKLKEIMQRRKTYEKLKEHAFETFLEEEKSKESREVDELTSYRYEQKIKED